MNKGCYLALLIVGSMLVVFGASAAETFGAEATQAFVSDPAQRALWMLAAGALSALVGLIGLARSGRLP